MDTVIYQKAYGKFAEKAVDEATKELQRLENLLSFFKDGSDIAQINSQAGKNWVKVSDDTFSVLETAIRVSEMSEGAFDMTIGGLTDYWRQLKKFQKKPDKKVIETLLGLVNYRDIQLDKENRLVKLSRSGQKIDPGGIGKGYAGEKVINVYRKHSISSAFINLGGNVVTIGKPYSRRHWVIGIRDPFSLKEEILGKVELRDQAVVTSGGYERYYEIEGFKYHHILDPRTGFPAESGWRSVTIVAESSTQADAISTAIFVSDWDETIRSIRLLPTIKVILITDKQEILISRNLKENFKKTNQKRPIIYID